MDDIKCKHEYTMQKFDIATEPSADGGVGINVVWCSSCGVLLKWNSQITNKRLVDLID